MSLVLNNHKLTLGLIGAFLIVGSISAEDLFDEISVIDTNNHTKTWWAVPLLFIIGWMFAVVAVGTLNCNEINWKDFWNTKGSGLAVFGSTMVVISVLLMQHFGHTGTSEQAIRKQQQLGLWMTTITAMFVIGLFIFAHSIASQPNSNIEKKWMAYGGAVLVISGMGILKLYQEPNGYINAPGMAMFGMGWIFISLATSVVSLQGIL